MSTEWDRDDPPTNRVDCKIHVTADDLEELIHALSSIRIDVIEKQHDGTETIQITSGGYGSGWDLKVSVTDPEQTGERYRDQLESWRLRRIAKRNAA